MASITTVDHDSSETPFEDWGTITSPRGTATVFPGDGGFRERDPSVMLGLVLVLVANTVVVAALVAAVVWILA